MLEFSVKSIRVNYLDYYNKLVFEKNLQNKFTKKTSRIIYKFNKSGSSNTVTLRAPKHFKVGRHHYHTITRRCFLLFQQFSISYAILDTQLYSYLNTLKKLIKKKNV